MKALIAEFGFEGYGRFWALCERVAESSCARVDISKKVNKLDLAAELGLDGNGLDGFLAFLADPEIDLVNLECGVITVDRISERFTEVAKDREGARDRKARKKDTPESSGEPCGSSEGKGESSGEPCKKVNKRKESKADERKQEKINSEKEGGGGKDPPKTETEEPPPLFSAIKSKIAAEGFFLGDKDIDRLIAETDPTWFGENCFVEFIAEVARGKPGYAEKTREGQRGLFRFLLFEAPERREEFPQWRDGREKKGRADGRAKMREDALRKAREPPTACPGCGGIMDPCRAGIAKCRSCGSWCVFDEEGKKWEFQSADESWENPVRRTEDIDF